MLKTKNSFKLKKQQPVLLLLRKVKSSAKKLQMNYCSKRVVLSIWSKLCNFYSFWVSPGRMQGLVQKPLHHDLSHYPCVSLSSSLRGPVWRSAWRRTTVSSFWWLPIQCQCGFGWMSSSRRQTSTAVTDLLHTWLCNPWVKLLSGQRSESFPPVYWAGLAEIHLRGWFCTWTHESVDKVREMQRCSGSRRSNTAEETVTWCLSGGGSSLNQLQTTSSLTQQSVTGRFHSLSLTSPSWSQCSITGLVLHHNTLQTGGGHTNSNTCTI